MKVKLAQINFIVGDLEGNFFKIKKAYEESADIDLIVFSELALTGYPPEDLLHKKYFIKKTEERIEELCALTKNKQTAILVGAPASFTDRYNNNSLYNSVFLIEKGGIVTIANKSNVPNYGVFDEKRYFSPAKSLTYLKFRDFEIAILICEDIWSAKNAFLLSDKDLDVVFVLNASPFEIGKLEQRVQVAQKFIKDIKAPLIYVNQVGASDSLVFDGGSFVLDKEGEVVTFLGEFVEDKGLVVLDKKKTCMKAQDRTSKQAQQQIDKFKMNSDGGTRKAGRGQFPVELATQERNKIYNACILGLRDYINKNGFEKVVIGMSGGIDSALVAAIATDALGSDKVKLVALPTKYNSGESLKDAILCSKNLGIELEDISIEPIFEVMKKTLSGQFSGQKEDLTEENLQSRIRANILMALSNKFGHLLISTGNKSEMAVGYATIYGDMCGAFNPLKDIYKTQVFQLAEWRNENVPQISLYKKEQIIPDNIITKEPSAELRDDQKDSDSLPEYEIMDKILYNLIEEEKSIEEIIGLGIDSKIVKEVAKLFYNSEYKRKQAVIGVKISKMSFDKDRRYQITNKFCQ